jgi:hypothetical protein
MRKHLALALFCVTTLACSSGPTGTATLHGNLQGRQASARDAIFASLPVGDGRQDAIVLSSEPQVCDATRENHRVPGETRLMFFLAQRDAAGALVPFTPGDFQIGAGDTAERGARAVYETYDSACSDTVADDAGAARSGKVTLSAVAEDFLDGTFDLTFKGGDHLTGDFHAALCAEPTQLPAQTCHTLRFDPESSAPSAVR